MTLTSEPYPNNTTPYIPATVAQAIELSWNKPLGVSITNYVLEMGWELREYIVGGSQRKSKKRKLATKSITETMSGRKVTSLLTRRYTTISILPANTTGYVVQLGSLLSAILAQECNLRDPNHEYMSRPEKPENYDYLIEWIREMDAGRNSLALNFEGRNMMIRVRLLVVDETGESMLGDEFGIDIDMTGEFPDFNEDICSNDG